MPVSKRQPRKKGIRTSGGSEKLRETRRSRPSVTRRRPVDRREPEKGADADRSRRLSRKLPPKMRPIRNNDMLELANNLTGLAAQIKVCTRCRLSQSRTQAVPGVGPEKAQIMFIGEAPGFYEDQQGQPFVGPAGKFLNELLSQIGLERKDVFITNVVKCRPPQNRDPQPDEIETCRIWLDQQIALIKPKVVVTISRYAMARWFPEKKISEIHGRARRFGDLVVVPMYHPAAALHQHSLRRVLEEDFNKLPEYIKNPGQVPGSTASSSSEAPPSQLKMF